MQTINTQNKTLLVVEVPEDASECHLHNEADEFYCYSLKYHIPFSGTYKTKLPHGNWKILGTITNGIADFDVEPYVKTVAAFQMGNMLSSKPSGETYKLYQNYKYDLPQPVDFTFTTPIESMQSLLTSSGIEWGNGKLVVLEKK